MPKVLRGVWLHSWSCLEIFIQSLDLDYSQKLYSSFYRILRLGGGVPGAMVPLGGGTFFIEEIKNFAFFKLENCQKMFKNQWKIYNFSKTLRKLCDFLKILSAFSQNLGKNLENFLNLDLSGIHGAEPPEASENIQKLVEKSMENC